MNGIPSYGQVIHDQLIATFTVATERALMATVQEIAAGLGVVTLNGMPVREFFERRKTQETEELIADFADVNPAAASHVKALWDGYNAKNDESAEAESSEA